MARFLRAGCSGSERHEFLAVITHPKIYRPPTSLQDAIQQVDYWMESPTLRLIGEAPGYWEHLKSTLLGGKAVGPLIHDARVAAICRAAGVREIWTADRDYARFAGIPARNPLMPGGWLAATYAMRAPR